VGYRTIAAHTGGGLEKLVVDPAPLVHDEPRGLFDANAPAIELHVALHPHGDRTAFHGNRASGFGPPKGHLSGRGVDSPMMRMATNASTGVKPIFDSAPRIHPSLPSPWRLQSYGVFAGCVTVTLAEDLTLACGGRGGAAGYGSCHQERIPRKALPPSSLVPARGSERITTVAFQLWKLSRYGVSSWASL